MESLTAARKACQAGTEPSDAIRVVNSVLTQLDQIKRSVNSHLWVTCSMMLEVLFTLLWSPSAVFKVLIFLNPNVSDVFATFASIFQTFQCRDPNNFQRDREDWLGICGQSWHQAVYRTPLCERHIQHLPLLSGGAHEGECCWFNKCVNQKSHYLLILWGWWSLFYGLSLPTKLWGYIQRRLCLWPALTYLRQVEYKYLLKYRKICARSVRSSTPGSSSSPYWSLRWWTLQRARCPHTAWSWGISLCE